MQLSTHVVTLGTRSTNSSLSSSRAASAGETRSTSNTSSTLWGWRVWMWEHWMCRIQEEQMWSMRMTLTGAPLAPGEPSVPGAPCEQKDRNKTSTLIQQHSAFFCKQTEKISIYSQQVQRVQQVQGFRAHHELPGVHLHHELPEDRSLPVEGSNRDSDICNFNIINVLKKQIKQRQSVRWRIRRATAQPAVFSFPLLLVLNISWCVCDFYN